MVHAAREARATELSTLSPVALAEHVRRVEQLGIDYQPVLQLAAAYYGGWIVGMQELLRRVKGGGSETLIGRLLAASGAVGASWIAFCRAGPTPGVMRGPRPSRNWLGTVRGCPDLENLLFY